MRTKELKNYTFKQDSAVIISKILFFSFSKAAVIGNQFQKAKSNKNSSNFLTYKTMKLKFKEHFLSIFCEDPSMATYGKTTWKLFKFI